MILDNKVTWVVIADSNICRIYHYSKKLNQLDLIKEINHPENKERDIDLTSDKPGHYQTGGSARGAYSQPMDPKEIKIDDYSREIAKELEHGRDTNAYEKLIVISLPHEEGLLFRHLNNHVKNLVTHNIKKNVLHLSHSDLLDFLHKNTQYETEKK